MENKDTIIVTGDQVNGKSVLIAEIPKGQRLEELNEAQKAHMETVRNHWLDYFFSCKNQVNKEAASIGIEWMYKLAGIERPIIIFLDSPMACQFAVPYLKEIMKVLPPLGGRNLAQVRDLVGAQVRDQVLAQVGAQVWDQVGDQGITFESFAAYGSIDDLGWISFFDFFQQIGVFNHNGFVQFKNLIQSGIYDMIQLNGFCIVSSLPSSIMRDASNRLHNVNGHAIEFRDGYKQFFIHSVAINPETYRLLLAKEYTFQQWVKEDNEEVKSAILSFMEEKWGSEYLFRFISDNLEEVDTYTDKKTEQYLEGTTGSMNIGVYTLFKGNLNNIKLAFVRCYCPSTDRMFFLSVDPVHKNAKNAIASLYRIPEKLKGYIKYIQRQGERFSTVFTDEGNAVLSSLAKEDIENLTTISGNEYFSKMRYEY